MKKESFIFYSSFYDALQGLTDEQKGKCFSAVCDYAINGLDPDLSDPIVRLFFTMAKPQIDANNHRYENGCKGGRPKKENKTETETKPKENQTETKVEPNDNDNDNVNDNVNNKKENNTKEKRYGELGNVKLTEEQYHTLLGKYPNIEQAIEKLDTWLGTSGSKNKNKNHFAYFKSNSWVWENIQNETKTEEHSEDILSKERTREFNVAERTKELLRQQMLKRYGS